MLANERQDVLLQSADFYHPLPCPARRSPSGYIDLSKRRVSSEDIEKCEEKYEKGKLVNSVLTHVAGKLEMDIEELYEKVAWPLGTKFGHAYDAFKLSIRCGRRPVLSLAAQRGTSADLCS